MMEWLLDIDRELFLWINRDLGNAFLDSVMPWWRDKMTWIPLYIFLLFFFIRQFGKRFYVPVLMLLLTVGISDFTASGIIKPGVGRLRPCQNPELKQEVIVRVPCGPGKSFPSAHATNHFAIALFITGLFAGKRWRIMKVAFILWAASIAFGQVYVGVHYPLDVLAGSILGSLIGLAGGKLTFRLLHRNFSG